MFMAPIESTTILALAPMASVQSVGEGAVVLLADSGQLFTCNETTEAFLLKLDGARSFAEVIDLLGAEFDADSDTLAADFGSLALQLLDEHVIQRTG